MLIPLVVCLLLWGGVTVASAMTGPTMKLGNNDQVREEGVYERNIYATTCYGYQDVYYNEDGSKRAVGYGPLADEYTYEILPDRSKSVSSTTVDVGGVNIVNEPGDGAGLILEDGRDVRSETSGVVNE